MIIQNKADLIVDNEMKSRSVATANTAHTAVPRHSLSELSSSDPRRLQKKQPSPLNNNVDHNTNYTALAVYMASKDYFFLSFWSEGC